MYSTELIKGTLKTVVLKLLVDNERMYGYEITQRVKELTDGKIVITEGALYPLLHKLEADGVLTTEKELIGKRARKYYSLTVEGRTKTQELIDEFLDFMITMKHVISHENGSYGLANG
tara:strand:+ start:495 stop:848 length:354 start_codon:yes stop_codon:yes gene_type:complete